MTDWVNPWWQCMVLPRTFDVGGFKLPPMSNWHSFILESIGNGFGRLGFDESSISMDDCACMIIICSRSRDEGQGLFWSDRSLQRAIQRTVKKMKHRPEAFWRAACVEYAEINLRHCSRFINNDAKPAATPGQWLLVAVLARSYHMPFTESWDYPIALSRSMYDAIAELDGDTSLLSVSAQAMEDNWDIIQGRS